MKRLIIMGSPRTTGRSAHLAEEIFEACIEDNPQNEAVLIPLSELDIMPCQACDACSKNGEEARGASSEIRVLAAEKKETEQRAAQSERDLVPQQNEAVSRDALGADAQGVLQCCYFNDDMTDIYDHILTADECIVVAPVFFSGPSATLKSFLDRLQPFFWTKLRHEKHAPATLHIIGEGGNPFGYESLIACVACALYTAGFDLDTVIDWTDCIDDEGEIVSQGQLVERSAALDVVASLVSGFEKKTYGEGIVEEVLEEPVEELLVGAIEETVQSPFGKQLDELAKKENRKPTSGKANKRNKSQNTHQRKHNQQNSSQRKTTSKGPAAGKKSARRATIRK